jgi:hypothetical protein
MTNAISPKITIVKSFMTLCSVVRGPGEVLEVHRQRLPTCPALLRRSGSALLRPGLIFTKLLRFLV